MTTKFRVALGLIILFCAACSPGPIGVEPGAGVSRALRHPGLEIEWSDRDRVPLRVTETVTAEDVAASDRLGRHCVFRVDTELPEGTRSTPDDYTRSGFDRGHLAAEHDFSTIEGKRLSCLMSNIAPQEPDLNRGLWVGIENAARGAAKSTGCVTIITGVVVESGARRIGADAVAVPSAFWKVVVSDSVVWAVLATNTTPSTCRTLSPADLARVPGVRLPASVAARSDRVGPAVVPGCPVK